MYNVGSGRPRSINSWLCRTSFCTHYGPSTPAPPHSSGKDERIMTHTSSNELTRHQNERQKIQISKQEIKLLLDLHTEMLCSGEGGGVVSDDAKKLGILTDIWNIDCVIRRLVKSLNRNLNCLLNFLQTSKRKNRESFYRAIPHICVI